MLVLSLVGWWWWGVGIGVGVLSLVGWWWWACRGFGSVVGKRGSLSSEYVAD